MGWRPGKYTQQFLVSSGAAAGETVGSAVEEAAKGVARGAAAIADVMTDIPRMMLDKTVEAAQDNLPTICAFAILGALLIWLLIRGLRHLNLDLTKAAGVASQGAMMGATGGAGSLAGGV
jgi:hypothetical protein